MSRTSRVRALAVTALLGVAGCQDYNFNPVGQCLIQPGTRRVQLSGVTSADVLFVIDDSGSMGGEQAALAANFKNFVRELNNANMNRIGGGLEPIDFHLAITTSSVFENLPDSNTPLCRNDCPGSGGTIAGSVCCKTNGPTSVGPLLVPKTCTGTEDDSCPTGSECRNDCVSYVGDYVCCKPPAPPAPARPVDTEVIPCTTLGAACGDLSTHYRISTDPLCTTVSQHPYPQGAFLASGSNPKVLHFDKEIYQANSDGMGCNPAVPPGCPNKQGQYVGDPDDPAPGTLISFFQQNVNVGVCGSEQEQGLAAARKALEYWMAQPQATREWLHPDSKLVLVFVGDEDDCSSPQDAATALVLSGNPGVDSCVADAELPPEEQRLTKVDEFTSYFSTVRPDMPLGAAFIVSAKSGTSNLCVDEACSPGICCGQCGATCTTNICGGQAPGTRLLEAAGELRGVGADVVAGSICDPDFGSILARIAEIVKPPTGLLLPTEPASEEVTLLRIAGGNGKTRTTCIGPAPETMDAAQATAAGYDWWFTLTREQVTDLQKHPSAVTRNVFINHATGHCEANPGETYAADYIGRLPANGCSGATAQEADDNCVAMLGGKPGDWTCYAGTDSADRCLIPTSPVVGTCLCGPRYVAPRAAGQPAGGLCSSGCAPGTDYCPDPSL